MSEFQQKHRINLPSDLDATDREKVAELAIERIVQRTDNGIDANGKKFAPYSKSYVESQDFKIAGKSKGDVNLQLSGDMINSIQILQNSPGYVTIGFNDGTPENDKAAYAQASDNGPSRKFLKLNDKELEQIIAEVKVSRPTSLKSLAKEEQRPKVVKSITDSFIKNLLKQLK